MKKIFSGLRHSVRRRNRDQQGDDHDLPTQTDLAQDLDPAETQVSPGSSRGAATRMSTTDKPHKKTKRASFSKQQMEILRSIEKKIHSNPSSKSLNISNSGLDSDILDYLIRKNVGFFSNLTKLEMYNNSNLKKFPNSMQNLVSLIDLNVLGCKIKTLKNIAQLGIPTLNVSKNPIDGRFLEDLVGSKLFDSVASIRANDCKLTSLNPFLGMSNLRKLYLDDNAFEEIPEEAHWPKLHTLSMSRCHLKGIEKFKFDRHPSLKTIFLSGNQIEKIPPQISLAKSLLDIGLANNKLKEVPPEIAELKLEQLDLGANRISQESIRKIRGIPSLTYINLSDNDIKTVPPLIYGSKKLKELGRENCGLTEVDLLGDLKLDSLFLHGNKISQQSLNNLANSELFKNLKKIHASRCDFKNIEWLTYLPNLEHIELSNNQIIRLPTPQHWIEEDGVSDAGSENYGTFRSKKISFISINGNKIETINNGFFSNLSALTQFSAINNKITKIPSDIVTATNLLVLLFENNYISEIPRGMLTALKKLQFINLSYNSFTDRKLNATQEGSDSLRIIEIEGNKISTLPYFVVHSPNLKELNISWCCFHEMPADQFSKMKNLQKVDIQCNPMTNMPNKAGKIDSEAASMAKRLNIPLGNIVRVQPDTEKITNDVRKIAGQRPGIMRTNQHLHQALATLNMMWHKYTFAEMLKEQSALEPAQIEGQPAQKSNILNFACNMVTCKKIALRHPEALIGARWLVNRADQRDEVSLAEIREAGGGCSTRSLDVAKKYYPLACIESGQKIDPNSLIRIGVSDFVSEMVRELDFDTTYTYPSGNRRDETAELIATICDMLFSSEHNRLHGFPEIKTHRKIPTKHSVHRLGETMIEGSQKNKKCMDALIRRLCDVKKDTGEPLNERCEVYLKESVIQGLGLEFLTNCISTPATDRINTTVQDAVNQVLQPLVMENDMTDPEENREVLEMINERQVRRFVIQEIAKKVPDCLEAVISGGPEEKINKIVEECEVAINEYSNKLIEKAEEPKNRYLAQELERQQERRSPTSSGAQAHLRM